MVKTTISADPQNLAWRNDSGGFGLNMYRMLNMMGWSEGKGLGVKEDGIKTFVRANKREQSLGLGADVNTSENWLANTSAFDGILSRLNSRTSVQENLAKMKEVPTPTSTGVTNKRLRFHKLVKAKTLSNHKAEDISAILAPRKDDTDVESDTDPIVDNKRKLEEESTIKIAKKRHIDKALSDSESSDSSDSESDSGSDSNSDSDASSSSDSDSSSSSDSDSNSDSDASSSSSSSSGSDSDASSDSEDDSDDDSSSGADSS